MLDASSYQRVHLPTYLDPYNVEGGLQAFRAGPRRDPLSRQTHLMSQSAVGRLPNQLPGGQHGRNLFGAAPTVPPRWPGTWQSDIDQHSQREPLRPI